MIQMLRLLVLVMIVVDGNKGGWRSCEQRRDNRESRGSRMEEEEVRVELFLPQTSGNPIWPQFDVFVENEQNTRSAGSFFPSRD